MHHHQTNDYHRQPVTVNGTKRDFASSFDTQPLEQPLRRGARPIVSGLDSRYTNSYQIEPAPQPGTPGDDEFSIDSMEYRRADGTARRRKIPLVN